MFLELAQLLPSQEQRSQLLRAAQQAGWTADAGTPGADAAEESPLKVHAPQMVLLPALPPNEQS